MISDRRPSRNLPVAEPGATRPKRPKRPYRLAVLLVVTICLAIAHAPILHGIARILVVDEQTDDARYIWLFDPAKNFRQADSPYDLTARLCRDDPSRKILLIEADFTRLVRAGIVPSFETISRQQLEARGVDREAIAAIDTPRNSWQAARRLRDWLQERPDGQVLAIGKRFRSRYHRVVLDSVLAAEEARRVKFVAVPDYRFDETNWWKSRTGAKEFFRSFVTLAYAWCHGEDTLEPPPWDPDQYEATLRSDRGDAP